MWTSYGDKADWMFILVRTDFEAPKHSGITFLLQHWRRAIRETKIRHRKFYATRHTFISAALASGVNTTWLAAYCGTSADMIEQHYARYLRDDTPQQLAKLTGNLAGTLPKPERQVVKMVGGIASGGGDSTLPNLAAEE